MPRKINACWCGCGGETGGKFIPGHNQRFYSLAKKVARGQEEWPKSFVNKEAEIDFRKVYNIELKPAPKPEEPKELKASESRLFEKAVRNGWDVPKSVKSLMLASVIRTLQSDDTNSRQKMAANRVLLSMNAQNIELEKVQSPQVVVQTGFNINNPTEAKKIAKELMKNNEFLNYQRSKLRNTKSGSENSLPSDVCDICEPLEDTAEGDLGSGEAPFKD